MDRLLDFNKKKAKKLLVSGALAALLLGAMMVYHAGWGKVSSDHENNHRLVLQKIWIEESRIRQWILSTIESLPSNADFEDLRDAYQKWNGPKDGLTVLGYRNDSLIYWSGNVVTLQKTWSEEAPTVSLIKTGNGWYMRIHANRGNLCLSAFLLLKNIYPYQNDYLVNAFNKNLGALHGADFSEDPGIYDIHSSDGSFLFSLVYSERPLMGKSHFTTCFILFLAGLFFLILAMYYTYDALNFLKNRNYLFLASFLADMIILRALILFLSIPGFLQETPLFGPEYFASSSLNPSLGDLVVHSLFLLFFAHVFHGRFRITRIDSISKTGRIALSLLILVIVSVMFFALMDFVGILVKDSNIDLNLNNIFNIDLYSLLGFLSLTSFVLSFFLLSSPLIKAVFFLNVTTRRYITVVISYILSISVFLLLAGRVNESFPESAILALFLIPFAYFLPRAHEYRTLPAAVFFIILFAFTVTYQLDRHYIAKEKEYRKLLSAELTSLRDPMLEYEFSGLKEKMLADTLIGSMLSDTLDDQRVSDHLRASYFHDFWKQYEILITPCHKEEMLSIQPEGYLIVCDIYFEGLIARFGRPTRDSGLFFLDNKAGGFNYLSYFDLPDVSGESYRIYVEFYSKLTDETGLGYPDLLIDKETKMTSELRDYSYARYYQGNLVYKYGEFQYSTAFRPMSGHSTGYFYNDGDYDHYVDAGDPENILVISRKGLSFLDLIAPFSYLFLFFGLFLLFFTLAVMLPGGFNAITALNFRNRLQGAIIFLIILSFISIGFITRSYIIRLNNNKNIDNLNEKTFSVLVELEHKLGDQAGINQDMEEYIGGLLYKFSLVFFSDINLYDVSGNLVASSRPQIFDAELISRKMEPVAFSKLAYENHLLFIQQEKIGQQEYLSAYIPFQNNEDKIVAYLNLPYFAKQTEMRREIADFLAAFINAYVLIIVLAVLLTILVSRYITKPLQLIREKMGKIVYGKANEKIEWAREDEIGSLVAEYNRMLDELTSSAERLARSERESAWREMAMQVAHEIKNPLTPMKLSVQHLQRAWDDKSPEFNERLTKFTQTIVEQIESLSEIATAFSDFARMPSGKPEIIELGSVASSAMELFHDQVNVRFEADLSHGPYPLYADPKQVLRIFNNLIRNAVEAVGKMPDGLVSITIKSEGDHYVLTITDNGSGMTESQAAKIFTPSFTTKTSGMGLGLAMVRSIVSEIGGTIRFTTVHGKGTTFIITLPRPERS